MKKLSCTFIVVLTFLLFLGCSNKGCIMDSSKKSSTYTESNSDVASGDVIANGSGNEINTFTVFNLISEDTAADEDSKFELANKVEFNINIELDDSTLKYLFTIAFVGQRGYSRSKKKNKKKISNKKDGLEEFY